MRPAGEIRQALVMALRDAKKARTSKELAAAATVGYEAARRTLDNLVRAEVAEQGAPARVPGVKRPVPTYLLRVPRQLPLQLEATQ